jgi:hypothetical protein
MTNIVIFGSTRRQPAIYYTLLQKAADSNKRNPYRPEIRAIITRCRRFTELTAPPTFPSLPDYSKR